MPQEYKDVIPTGNLVTGPMLQDNFIISSYFANFEGLTKILLTPSKMDGFSIFQILLLVNIWD